MEHGSFFRRPLFWVILVIVGALLVGYFFGEPRDYEAMSFVDPGGVR